MKKAFLLLFALLVTQFSSGQGFGIPSKKGIIGFGNLPRFTGIRLNFKDHNVEKINGINLTVWQPQGDDEQTGTVNGISIGLPMAMGTENRHGIGVGVFGVGAMNKLSGINIGGLGVGAGGDVVGINIGGLGVGTGGNLKGFNFGGLGVGSGENVGGINIGGLGVGAGENLSGFSFGGLGVGAGGKLNGVSIGILGVGAGDNVNGISVAGLAVGAGQKVTGITVAGLAVGAGTSVNGIALAAGAVGSVEVNALAVAAVVGGMELKGLMIAPAYMQVGHREKNKTDNGIEYHEQEGHFTGVSISAYNHIKGDQKGVAIGVVNSTYRIKGFQIGLLNYVKENPKGLRLLPLFNTRFYKKAPPAQWPD